MRNNTIVIVTYNTKELIQNCYNSIKATKSLSNIIIVDGSEMGNTCKSYLSHIDKRLNTIVIDAKNNIGHGKGMDIGIKAAITDYVTIMDSDTIMKINPIKKMIELLGDNYGIGQVMDVNNAGINVDNGIKYLHPYFALINRQKYLDNKPFIHHGAPCIETMINLHERNLSNEIIDFPVENYITHLGRGTRVLNPKHFHSKFWDKI